MYIYVHSDIRTTNYNDTITNYDDKVYCDVRNMNHDVTVVLIIIISILTSQS